MRPHVADGLLHPEQRHSGLAANLRAARAAASVRRGLVPPRLARAHRGRAQSPGGQGVVHRHQPGPALASCPSGRMDPECRLAPGVPRTGSLRVRRGRCGRGARPPSRGADRDDPRRVHEPGRTGSMALGNRVLGLGSLRRCALHPALRPRSHPRGRRRRGRPADGGRDRTVHS